MSCKNSQTTVEMLVFDNFDINNLNNINRLFINKKSRFLTGAEILV